MFHVGDIIRCKDFRADQPGLPPVKGLMFSQRFEVSRVKNWPDGSQSLWVRAAPRDPNRAHKRHMDMSERGPYSHLRFSIEDVSLRMAEYDPTQMGDTDDDI
jgi:hypothetical protein